MPFPDPNPDRDHNHDPGARAAAPPPAPAPAGPPVGFAAWRGRAVEVAFLLSSAAGLAWLALAL